ncbi:MAG: UbiA family prenyltransferase [Jatrophihabitans sp.]
MDAAANPIGSPRAAAPGLLLSCHPVPTAGVTLVSALLAAGVGLPAAQVALLTGAVLTGQLSIGWSNDCIDADRDAATARPDKPAATGRVPRNLVAGAAGVALVATVALSFTLGLPAALALLTLVASGWIYNLGLKGTVLSGLAYLVGFGALPLAPSLALPGHPLPPWWVPAAGALLGLGAHVANVLPDLRADAATGVRGLPQRLGARISTILMAAALAGAAVVLGLGPDRSVLLGVGASLVGLGGAAAVAILALRSPGSPAAFRVTILLALVDVGLVLALV